MSTFYLFVFRDWPAGAVQTQQLQLLRGDVALADGVVLHEGDVAAVHEAAQRPLRVVLCSAPSVPQPVVQSWRRPLLGPSPG